MAVSIQLKKSETYGVSTRDRAKFGWLSVEGVDLPYIVRDGREKFIPVKMVEKYILCYYPSTYPKELEDKPPLVCTFMKQEESDLLNKCCGKRAGFTERFTKTDPVVKVNDFLTFFGPVKSAYPDVVIGSVADVEVDLSGGNNTEFGWVLVKDAMIPYVVRGDMRFAPINVIRGAAQMLIGVQVDSTCATEDEVACLNEMCQKVGLVFTFQTNTSLTNLRLLELYDSQCVIQDLPKDNPMDFVNGSASGLRSTSSKSQSASRKAKPSTSTHTSTAAMGSNGKGETMHGAGSASKSLQALANMAKGHLHEELKTNVKPVSKGSPGLKAILSKKSPTPQPSAAKPPSAKNVSASVTKDSSSSSKQEAKSSVVIQAMECHGKTISCLIRGRSSLAFALVEAVCRVYFPSSSLVDFIHFMEMDLAITLYVLKKSEEEAFIDFYGIPTKQLRCNQVIKLKDLRDRMPRLVARFGSATQQQQISGASPSTKKAAGTDTSKNASNKSGSGNTSPSAASDPPLLPADEEEELLDVMETNSSSEATNNYYSNGALDAASRSSGSPLGGCDVTQTADGARKTKSLESTIMRLLDKKNTSDIDPLELELASGCSESGTRGDERDSDKEEQQHSPKAAAAPTNKRKATPRRCSPQKKLALIIDGVRTEIEENQSPVSDESDMEEYA